MRNKRRGRRARILSRPKPIWFVIIMYALALGVALILFALPHHVISYEIEPVGKTTTRKTSAVTPVPVPVDTPAPTPTPTTVAEIAPTEAPAAIVTDVNGTVLDATAQPTVDIAVMPTPILTPTPEPTPVPVDAEGSFAIKYADKFTSGEVISTDNTYQSANLNITYTEYNEYNVVFHVIDFYVRDISCLRNVFAKDKYGKSISEDIQDVSRRTGCIVAINGDYYGVRDGGVCLRNGELCHSKEIYRDIFVLYWNGEMKCFAEEDFNCETEMANGAYQIWNFGPTLLNGSGEAIDVFPERYYDIRGNHPRTVLGYYEPGHYCFITVDGRQSASKGLNLVNLSKLVETLGCTQAYNMDGGKTSQMTMYGKLVNNPPDGGRNCSDFICLFDEVQ